MICRGRIVASLTLAGALFACVPTDVPLGEPPASSSASAGTTPIPTADAVNLFQSVCSKTEPDFAGASGRLGPVFVRSAQSGTYFHQQFDLNFRINQGGTTGCAMSFRSNDGTGVIASAFGGLDPAPRTASLGGGYQRVSLPGS